MLVNNSIEQIRAGLEAFRARGEVLLEGDIEEFSTFKDEQICLARETQQNEAGKFAVKQL